MENPDYDLDEVEKKIAEQMGFDATNDDRYKILEMNVNLDLEGYEDEDGKRKNRNSAAICSYYR